MAQAAVIRAHNRAANKGSDPRVATCRGKLQNRRSKLNQEINRELRLRAGAENLFRATTNRKMKETVALELSFVNSNLQLLKEQLAELNGSVEIYQSESSDPVMPMIPLGLKETKEIDFREPFKDFILEHYSEDGNKYDRVITEFMELRQGMRTPQRDGTGISLLLQYYNHLYFVERRFFPPDRSLGIYFEWYDSLTGVPSCQRTVAFEKASVLFNLGALETQVAARRGRNDASELDRAVRGFLSAAGALGYLLDNFTNAPSTDLSPPVLDVLAHLMLAQARECLLEKLELQTKGERSPETCLHLAGEAAKIAEVYEEAEEMTREAKDYLPHSWSSLCGVKREHYRGAACRGAGLALLAAASRGPPPPSLLRLFRESLPELTPDLAVLGAAQLKTALGHHEEAARLTRMCRELRAKRCLSQVLSRAARESEECYRSVDEDSRRQAELLDPPPLRGKSEMVLRLSLPDFGQERVDDLFGGLGPLAVFSAKHHWSAPRTVTLHHPVAASETSLGFTVSTDCPVVVTSVQPNSLAHLGGIKEGDFVVGIGERDVKWASHEEVVRLIREAAEHLSIRLVTPSSGNSYLKASRNSSKLSKRTEGESAKAKTSAVQKKHSWNPFKRQREVGEAALALVSR